VGWGSKQTQFHGSLGKAAAQASSTPVHAVGSSPDDDGLPRVSWRTDAAFFAVSSLEGNSAATNTESPKTRRVLRVYDRTGALQSTGEALAGLEHSLAWRPAGTGGSAQLLASTQRFGYPGGGVGRAGRHDIVFFERNGLRHGEFGLRIKSTGSSLGKDGRDWSYRVKELAWSADATVLAVWIEAETNDYGMSNY
jgi:elongator complex protein 1